MADKLITVAGFRNLSEAYLAKGRLESEGVEVFLADENVIGMSWYYADAIGGVKLQVREQDLEDARKVLESFTPSDDTAEPSGEGGSKTPKCPRCASQAVSFGRADSGARLAALWVLSLPLPHLTPECWRCADCGAAWVEVSDEEEGSQESGG